MAKKSFILHLDSLRIHDKLSDEQLGKLFRAMILFQNGEDFELDFALDLAFESFKNQFIRDNEKYDEFAKKQSDNGKKGGRPKKPKETQKTQAFLDKPKKAYNVSVNDNVSKNKKDSKSESVHTQKKSEIISDEEINNYGKEVCGEFVRLTFLEKDALLKMCDFDQSLFDEIVEELNSAIERASPAVISAKYYNHFAAFKVFLRTKKNSKEFKNKGSTDAELEAQINQQYDEALKNRKS